MVDILLLIIQLNLCYQVNIFILLYFYIAKNLTTHMCNSSLFKSNLA